MEPEDIVKILEDSPSPAYVVHTGKLQENLATLDQVQLRTPAKILLALKGFAMAATFPQIRKVLHGVCASSPHEAQLGREGFAREVHGFAPAFKPADLDRMLQFCDHLVLNSFGQWNRFKNRIQNHPRPISVGLRINPEHSTGEVPLYDPCAPGSRLGILRTEFDGQSLDGIDGLHFHTLCEQNSDALASTLEAVEARFGEFLPNLQWLNFGGGHHITRPDYDLERLIERIQYFSENYNLQIYLEPGEAVALNTGILVTEVVDILHRPKPVAILDTSVTAHMPDVLEMPYRPVIFNSADPGVKAHTYQLGGLTCLAGDVIGDWSFDQPLQIGQRLAFMDMAHYTMVKNTTFNGIQLPAIATFDPETPRVRTHREFGFEDYRSRLS